MRSRLQYLFRSTRGLCLLAIGLVALVTAIWMTLSGPMAEWGVRDAVVSLLGMTLDPVQREGRIISLYHSIAFAVIAVLVYLITDRVPMKAEQQANINTVTTVGYLLAMFSGLIFGYFGQNWVFHGLFLVGQALLFYAGILLAVALWPFAPAYRQHDPAYARTRGGRTRPALTLAFYPTPELRQLAASLGLGAEPLAPDGDPAADATARELAWLPLLAGWSAYRTLPGSRLLAVAGYRRAALVAFDPPGRPAGPSQGKAVDSGRSVPSGASQGKAAEVDGPAAVRTPVWAPLGCDALGCALAPAERGPLLLEEPARLREAIRAGRVRRALLGGEDLAWALTLPGARAVRPLAGPGLYWAPVWGLFSRGARLALPDPPPEPNPHLALAPAEAVPGLAGWLKEAIPT